MRIKSSSYMCFVGYAAWAFGCGPFPRMFYKTAETSHGIPQKAGPEKHHLYGRHLGSKPEVREISVPSFTDNGTAHASRPSGKQTQVHTRPNSAPGGLSGIHRRLNEDDPLSSDQ